MSLTEFEDEQIRKGPRDFVAVIDEIRTHARLEAEAKPRPLEACGFVIETKERERVVFRCVNTHPRPHSFYQISAEDTRHALGMGRIQAVYHSHPFARSTPSVGDLKASQIIDLPMIIFAWPRDEWEVVMPDPELRIELNGRPFVHGVLDCYTYVQDYHRELHGIVLPNFSREDHWWVRRGTRPLSNLYMENFEKAGFIRLNKSIAKIAIDDCVLVRVDSEVANHAAVYIGAGRVGHHRYGRISGPEYFSPEMQQNTVAIVRHRELIS